MLPSKLDLSGRDLQDVKREFLYLLMHIEANEKRDMSKEEVEHWNTDMNGWINWFESLKK